MSPQPSDSALKLEELITLLELQRCTFTDQYSRPTHNQVKAMLKANRLISENDAESLKRNSNKKKAWQIMTDFGGCVSSEIFVLCALAVTISALGFSKLGDDYKDRIADWWAAVKHPIGLTELAARLLRLSKDKDLTVAEAFAPPYDDSVCSIAPPPRKAITPNIPSCNLDERSPKRLRLQSPQNLVNPVLPFGDYCTFAFMRRHMTENVPEPFRTAIKVSKLWSREEESRGLEITNCVNIKLPVTFGEDAEIIFRVGYGSGFDICNLFGMGDPDEEVIVTKPDLDSSTSPLFSTRR